MSAGIRPGPSRGSAVADTWQGWKDLFWRTYEQIGEDRLLAVAAGVVFYGLLAVFPAATALVSLCGLFARSARSHGQLACYHKSRVADRDVGMSADMIRADALSAAGLYLLLSPTDWTK
jgi:uncharacterized BrkB/YihY/UPF0761 family membrane protein